MRINSETRILLAFPNSKSFRPSFFFPSFQSCQSTLAKHTPCVSKSKERCHRLLPPHPKHLRSIKCVYQSKPTPKTFAASMVHQMGAFKGHSHMIARGLRGQISHQIAPLRSAWYKKKRHNGARSNRMRRKWRASVWRHLELGISNNLPTD